MQRWATGPISIQSPTHGSSPARPFFRSLAIFISAMGSADLHKAFHPRDTFPPYATPETAQARHGMSQASQSNRFGGNLLGHCMCMTRCDAVFGIAAAAVAAGPRTCMPTRRTLYPCATRASSGHPSREKGGRVEEAFCNMWANKAPPFKRHLEPVN